MNGYPEYILRLSKSLLKLAVRVEKGLHKLSYAHWVAASSGSSFTAGISLLAGVAAEVAGVAASEGEGFDPAAAVESGGLARLSDGLGASPADTFADVAEEAEALADGTAARVTAGAETVDEAGSDFEAEVEAGAEVEAEAEIGT